MFVFLRTSRSVFIAKRERSAIGTARYGRKDWIRLKPKSSSILCNPPRASRRVRKLLTDRAQAVVSQPYTAYSFTLKRLVKLLYGKIPYEGKIGYESENMRHCRETVDAITNCILKNGRSKIAYEKLTAELAARDGEILRLCERNKIRNPDRFLYAETFQRDLYRRMGNIVIERDTQKAPRRTAESARNPSCQSAAESISGKSTDCIRLLWKLPQERMRKRRNAFGSFEKSSNLPKPNGS